VRRPWPTRADARLSEVGADPDYRFSLANERTFLAYLRTALALFVAGGAVLELVGITGNPRADAALGIGLMGLGVLTAAASYRRWESTERAMRLSAPLTLGPIPWLLAVLLTTLLGLALAVAVLGR